MEKIKNKNIYYWLGLIPLFLLAIFIRIQNLKLLQGRYLIELDSYHFFRYAQMLFTQGSLPAVDAMKYVPVGSKTATALFFPQTMVWFYKAIHTVFTNLSQMEWHIIYPVVITIISFVFFFLFVKELFNYKTAFVSTAFLAVATSYIQRTMSGFADHEAMAMLWMFLSLWLFMLAWKRKTFFSYLLMPCAALSGIFAGMMAGTWGGYVFLVYPVAAFVLLYVTFTQKLEWSKITAYGLWVLLYILTNIKTMGLVAIGKTWLILPNVIPLFVLAYILIHKAIRRWTKPWHPLVAYGIAGGLAIPTALLLKINIMDLWYQLTRGNVVRWYYTVSENIRPSLQSWWSSFNFILVLAVLGLIVCVYWLVKTRNIDECYNYWFAIIFSVLLIAAATGQIRLFFPVTIPFVLLGGIFVSNVLDKAAKTPYYKNILMIIIFICAIFFVNAAVGSYTINRSSGSMVPGQWETTMDWINTNTPTDSVFASWWDYGHLILTVGGRATVTDGGNERDWNHASGRYLLTGSDAQSTLSYLKTHKVTHVLISDQEIAKYPAYSLIASDDNYDRYSSIGIFALQQNKEVRDGTQYIYGGYWSLDAPHTFDGLVLTEQNSAINGFSFTANESGILSANAALITSTGKTLIKPLSCVVYQGKMMQFQSDENTMPGCLMLVPYYKLDGTGMSIGGAFWLSEKVYNTNFANLYLYNATSSYFKLVYESNTPLGITEGGSIIGPIKIWEINYPVDIQADPQYLEASKYG